MCSPTKKDSKCGELVGKYCPGTGPPGRWYGYVSTQTGSSQLSMHKVHKNFNPFSTVGRHCRLHFNTKKVQDSGITSLLNPVQQGYIGNSVSL